MASPTIQLGSSNSAAVKEAQYLLVNLFYLPANTAPGVFGPIMMGAVQAFQKMNGLQVDGVIGPNTWAALRSPGAVAANGTPKAPGVAAGGMNYTTAVRVAADAVGPGPSATWEFEPMEITGRMPSKVGAWWTGLSPIAKAASVSLALGVGIMVFGGGKGRR